ncbi:phage integrase SAM-like domain-containing protein [Maribellus sp. CM-23]|uniref:site-specific integrase n=1 Tax=Maribellus sp. CM-23 TaxID=2781026 RepID=UPI001F2D284D|nr:site-specific integrase [Maribellus sp. CM-23]MCE4564343.1 phage integrase SAM-like domain-containing protein [Maribellus sp. CM-23]
MATVKAFIRVSKTKSQSANVRFRLSAGRNEQYFYTSEQLIDPNVWDSKSEGINPKVAYDKTKRNAFNKFIGNRRQLILEIYIESTEADRKEKNWLDNKIQTILHPERTETERVVKTESVFFSLYDQFLAERNSTDRIKQHYTAVKRMMQRFELFSQIDNPNFQLKLDEVDASLLRAFDTYLIDEPKLFKKHKQIFEAVPDSRPPKQRGQNRRNKIFRYIRTFYKWANDNDITSNNPFSRFKIKEDVVGSPIYINITERNNLLHFDLSSNERLAIQRDIFVFQCLIGCRVGDLVNLTKDNLINGAIEYIPRKTKEGRPITVRVPLNETAKEILARYADTYSQKLLPFIAEQNYNYAIKDIFELAGLTRKVTVINTITGEEEKKPLNEVASSHLARRTFAGNLYKKVKDPNLVGSLTGHKEGSKAFSRYREIDEEIKCDLVKLLE